MVEGLEAVETVVMERVRGLVVRAVRQMVEREVIIVMDQAQHLAAAVLLPVGQEAMGR